MSKKDENLFNFHLSFLTIFFFCKLSKIIYNAPAVFAIYFVAFHNLYVYFLTNIVKNRLVSVIMFIKPHLLYRLPSPKRRL